MGKAQLKARLKARSKHQFGNELNITGSLKEQPLFDGYGPASSQLNGGQCVTSNNTPASLESALKFNELTGRINFGSRARSRTSKKIKKLSKKIKKSLKKIKKLKKKRSKRRFGSGSGSGSLEQNTKLGLPSYETSPSTIYNDSYLERGARPPIPYGPVDNTRMSMFTHYNGFGNRSRSRSRSRFGQTPGSSDWKIQQETPLEKVLDSYAQPYLAQAKGMFSPDIELYGSANHASYLNQSSTPSFNVPMQYADNQYNYPVVRNFGSRTRTNSKKRRFGAMLPSSNMYGPNNVGHESQIPMYHAGSTTINFADNQLYSPIGMVGGPTNSTGQYASVGTSTSQLLKVLPDGMTPNAYLAEANPSSLGSDPGSQLGFGPNPPPLTTAYSPNGNPNSLARFGKSTRTSSKRRFGELIANISSIANGSGLLTLAQPLPSYLDKSREVVGGDYVSFGKKKNKHMVKPVVKPPVPKHKHSKKPKLVPEGAKPVSTKKSKCNSFGSKSTLTLDQVGTVNITKKP